VLEGTRRFWMVEEEKKGDLGRGGKVQRRKR
jgi:hypothetical protein